MIRLVVIVKIYNLENGFDSNRSPAPFCRYLFFFVNMFLSKLKHMHKKKPCIYKASSIVGVAGFEPATSSSQTRRDNRATLHPEIISVCKSTVLFLHSKIITRNNFF